MPKMKTKSSAKKRFTVTASGKIRRHLAGHRHILTKKRPDTKRRLEQSAEVTKADYKRIRVMIPYK